MMNIIEIKNLTKKFNNTEAVSEVNMNVKKGEIYGFLGPNGAGKTTIMKMLLNLLKATYGEIRLFGEDVNIKSYDYLKRIGSMIEYPVFYENLTGRQNLKIHCKYMGDYDKERIEEALILVNLVGTKGKKVKEYSLGMKQRLGLARAIVTKPELLILDEPINGLDPVGIQEVRSLLLKLSKEYGVTIFISSHIISEIEQIADTIAVINKGRIIKEVTSEKAKEENTAYTSIVIDDVKKAVYIIDSQLGIKNLKVISDKEIHIYDTGVVQGLLNKTLVMNDVTVESITKKEGTLEDYFLSLIEEGDLGV